MIDFFGKNKWMSKIIEYVLLSDDAKNSEIMVIEENIVFFYP